jgi:hypothetical protein
MRPSLRRLVSCMERVLAAHRRTHYLWQADDESDAALLARIRAKIASGEAGADDQFITFRWRAPTVTAAEK